VYATSPSVGSVERVEPASKSQKATSPAQGCMGEISKGPRVRTVAHRFKTSVAGSGHCRCVASAHTSIRLAISVKEMPRASAILQSRCTVGLIIPRSTRLMYVRSNPHSALRRSCDWPLFSRNSRTAAPTARDRGSVGWTCLWRRCIGRSDIATVRLISQRRIRLICRTSMGCRV
jgi:hypothetical protein